MNEILLPVLCGISLAVNILVLAALYRMRKDGRRDESGLRMEEKLTQELRESRQEMLSELREGRLESANLAAQRQVILGQELTKSLESFRVTMAELSGQMDRRLEAMRKSVDERLAAIQQDNQKKLDDMRATVDEKLQKTLDERVGQSFKIVSERLEQVYKGLGEMQTLASGVGDLKRVLSNVKTRGILGELQLSRILEQVMTPAQYEENVATKRGSANRVEFAVKLPGKDDGEGPVYLPIDSKFPSEPYSALLDAYDAGDPVQIEQAGKQLEGAIRQFAKDIADKYIDPPHTTDFAVMFLPFEGLYAEIVRRSDLLDTLQRTYHVNVAGPTTVTALLSSLQMGFKTLAIEKRSLEVWNLLSAVKTEFGTFAAALETAQKRIESAGTELDRLVGTRTRVMMRKLKSVESMPDEEAMRLLSDDEAELKYIDE